MIELPNTRMNFPSFKQMNRNLAIRQGRIKVTGVNLGKLNSIPSEEIKVGSIYKVNFFHLSNSFYNKNELELIKIYDIELIADKKRFYFKRLFLESCSDIEKKEDSFVSFIQEMSLEEAFEFCYENELQEIQILCEDLEHIKKNRPNAIYSIKVGRNIYETKSNKVDLDKIIVSDLENKITTKQQELISMREEFFKQWT